MSVRDLNVGNSRPQRESVYMSDHQPQKIGFIGLGRMGCPMASSLHRKGFELLVYDPNPSAVDALKQLGARAAAGIPEVARASDIIITMVPSSADVETIVLGPDGLLAHGRAGQTILDMSTIDPATTDLIAKRAAALGVSVVDAPVGRLAAHADRGECLFMVGAEQSDFERVLPLLQAMGTTIFHCGTVGSGTRTKLVNNYLAVVSCQLNAEALALSQSFGLDLDKTLEVINGTSAFNGQLRLNWANKVLIGDTAPGFTIELAHKDLTLILNAANAAKVPLPVAAAAREMLLSRAILVMRKPTSRRWRTFSANLPRLRSHASADDDQVPAVSARLAADAGSIDLRDFSSAKQGHIAAQVSCEDVERAPDTCFAGGGKSIEVRSREGNRASAQAHSLQDVRPATNTSVENHFGSSGHSTDDSFENIDRRGGVVELAATMIADHDSVEAGGDGARRVVFADDSLDDAGSVPLTQQPFRVAPGKTSVELLGDKLSEARGTHVLGEVGVLDGWLAEIVPGPCRPLQRFPRLPYANLRWNGEPVARIAHAIAGDGEVDRENQR